MSDHDVDTMRDEYDFSNARPNPYAKRMKAEGKVVLLEPDLQEVFPDSAAVNAALRMVMRAGARAASARAREKRAS